MIGAAAVLELEPIDELPIEIDLVGPQSYLDSHALAKRRLAGHLVKMAQRLHYVLGHGHAVGSEHAGIFRGNRRRYGERTVPAAARKDDGWLLCQLKPCIDSRLLIEACGCRVFLTVLREPGSRADRRNRKRLRIESDLTD